MELAEIDLDKLRNGEENQLIALRKASMDLGFFKLVNHGIPTELMSDVLTEMENFFSLPQEKKRKCNRSLENPFGFNDSELTKQKKDSKEVFDIGPNADSQKWPAVESFQSVMSSYYEECHRVSRDLILMIAISLGE